MRIGHGYDVHRLVVGRKLILGGVEVPFEKGLDGHSDADVLVHAVMDAMLGAVALGDIGKLFPDNDDAYLGADSMELLKKVRDVLRAHGWRLGNLDATVIAQRPKLKDFIPCGRILRACWRRTSRMSASRRRRRSGSALREAARESRRTLCASSSAYERKAQMPLLVLAEGTARREDSGSLHAGRHTRFAHRQPERDV